MILCYNSHGNSKKGLHVWENENIYISHIIHKELTKYIISNKNSVELRPITVSRKNVNFNITESEVQLVNIQKLMNVFPLGLLSSMSELGIDISIFMARKLIQLIKIAKSKMGYDIDIFARMVLWYIMRNSDKTDEYSLFDKEELVELETNYYAYELKINQTNELAVMAKEMYDRIFSNLKTLFDAEECGEITLLYNDVDFKTFIDLDLNVKNAILSLYNSYGNYNAKYFYKIFHDVGLENPFQIIEVVTKNSQKEVKIVVEDEFENLAQESLEKKKIEIIDFPISNVFGA